MCRCKQEQCKNRESLKEQFSNNLCEQIEKKRKLLITIKIICVNGLNVYHNIRLTPSQWPSKNNCNYLILTLMYWHKVPKVSVQFLSRFWPAQIQMSDASPARLDQTKNYIKINHKITMSFSVYYHRKPIIMPHIHLAWPCCISKCTELVDRYKRVLY